MRVTVTSDWSEALAAFGAPHRDVYFTPEYHRLHLEEGAPKATLVEEGPHRLLVPGLEVPIPGADAFDLQTPNGYGGPLATPNAPAGFLEEAWAAFCQRARERGVVAAFFRLHPLLEQRPWLPASAAVRQDRVTRFVDLSQGAEGALAKSEAQHQKKVRRALREAVPYRWGSEEDWAQFPAFYVAAMQRAGAPGRLWFGPEYFARLRDVKGAELVCTRDARGLVGGHLFLFGPTWGHSHLAGRREDAPALTMHFLMHLGLERAAALGLRGVHLGGGITTAPDDGVLRFKRSHSDVELPFHVARVVTDEPRFQALLSTWTARHGERPLWLLGYRQPAPVR